MAKKTNYTLSNGKEVYRIRRKVGKKLNADGKWVDDVKAFYGSCKSEAEAKYEEYKRTLDNGCKNLTEDCVGEAIDKWIDSVFNYCNLADSTKKRYVDTYSNYFKPTKYAGIPLSHIEAMDVQEFYNTATCPHSAIKGINNLFSHFFKYCELNGLHRNIMSAVTLPKKKKTSDHIDKDIDVWADADLQKVITALEGNRLRLFVVLAVNTGARFSELLALTYDDVQGNVLRINKQLTEVEYGANKGLRISNTKTISSNRYIPLDDVTIQEIEKHKRMQKAEMRANKYTTDFLFTTSTGEFYWRSIVSRALSRLYKRIGVPQHNVHAYRHTFGTNLSRAGVPIEETQALMGHSDIRVTSKYYVHIDALRKMDAIKKISKFSYGAPAIEEKNEAELVYLQAL